MEIPNSNIPKLSTQEKIMFKMIYPTTKSIPQRDEEEEQMAKEKITKVNKKMQSDAMKLKYVTSYPFTGSGYTAYGRGYTVAPQYDGNGYAAAPQSSGGYATAMGKVGGGVPSSGDDTKEGGIVLATLATAGLTAAITGAAGVFGKNIMEQVYPHVKPTIEKGIHKIRDFFKGNGVEGKVPPSVMRLKNVTPLEYYKLHFKDLNNNLKYLKAPEPFRQMYLAKRKKKLLGGSLSMRVLKAIGKPNEGGIRGALKYSHIALPLIYRGVKEVVRTPNKEPLGKAIGAIAKYSHQIAKRMTKRELQAEEPHMETLAKELKHVKGSGAVGKLSPSQVDEILDRIIRRVKSMGVTHQQKYKIKKAFRRYAKQKSLSLPSFKGIKSGKDILARIEASDLDPQHKEALVAIGDMIVSQKFGGKISASILSQLELSTKDPKHMLAVRKELLRLGTKEEIMEELKKPDSKLVKALKYAGISVGVIAAMILGLGAYGKYTADPYLGSLHEIPTRTIGEFLENIYKTRVQGSGMSPNMIKYLNLNPEMEKKVMKKIETYDNVKELKQDLKTNSFWQKVASATGMTLKVIGGIVVAYFLAMAGAAIVDGFRDARRKMKTGEGISSNVLGLKDLFLPAKMENRVIKKIKSYDDHNELKKDIENDPFWKEVSEKSGKSIKELKQIAKAVFEYRLYDKINYVKDHGYSGGKINPKVLQQLAKDLEDKAKSQQEVNKILHTQKYKTILKWLAIGVGGTALLGAAIWAIIKKKKKIHGSEEIEMQKPEEQRKKETLV